MKFIVGFNESGEMSFATPTMEKLYKRMASFYGKTKTFVELEFHEKSTNSNTNQHQLFKRICMMIVKDTGQDYASIFKDFMKHTPTVETDGLFGKMIERHKTLEELNTKEFQEFLEKVLISANEIIGTELILYYDEKIGNILTTR